MADLHETAKELVADNRGILAADESSGTIEKRFDSIGLESTEENRRAYRDMLFTTPGFGDFISGVILFDETIRQRSADGRPFVEILSEAGILAGIKVDAGTKPLAGFADEVVVDFPSVVPALDRIRRAFLADERPRPLSAALELTTRDALEGTTVPLSVPVRRTCRTCGGRGESWTECCVPCTGTGVEFIRQSLQVTVPAGVADGTTVHFTVMVPQQPPTRIELRIAVA